MQKEVTGSINKIFAAILIGVMLILMIGIVVSGWQTDSNGENSGDNGNITVNADNLNGDTDKNNGTADNFSSSEISQPKSPEYVNYLTGAEISEKDQNRNPFVIVTDPNALSYGISRAELTVEIPIENGGTRMLTYITDISDLGKLGALRSTRKYITSITSFFGGLVIANGNDDIVSYTALSSEIAIDLSKHSDAVHMENGKSLYTDGESIMKIVKDEGTDLISYKRPTLPFDFCAFDESVYGKSYATEILIPYSDSNSTAFVYDASSKAYVLYKNERIKTDMLNGEAVAYKNVFLLFADVITYETAYGTESIVKNDTSGTGYYFSCGTLTEIKWSVDPSGNLIFKDLSGKRLEVNRGNSFIGYYKSSDADAVTFK